MTQVHIKMPNLGESVTEASIVTWQVGPGDQVAKYDTLLEAQSDKVTTEIPSDYEGTIKEILVEEGETVAIGTEILVIETDAEGEDDASAAEEEQREEKVSQEETTRANQSSPDKEVAKPQQSTNSDVPRYSPAVIRIAQEKGIDLDQVTGTGRNGRITRKDVLNYDGQASTSAESQAASADQEETATVAQAEQTGHAEMPTPAAIEESPQTDPSQDVAKSKTSGSTNTTSVSQKSSEGKSHSAKADGVRQAIAKKMVQSSTEIPHAWLQVEADVSNLVTLRDQEKDKFHQREEVKLSYFPFFVKAVAQALKKNPSLNSSWQDGNIVTYDDINLSIAVAAEDKLYVPVIKHVDNLSITGIAKEVDRLARSARQGKLSSEDMTGGTMTVNNTGVFGSVSSMGIINFPQAAILQVESINKRVVPTEDNGFKFAHMVNLCLSIDHRILDGLAAGRFLADVKTNLAAFTKESDIY